MGLFGSLKLLSLSLDLLVEKALIPDLNEREPDEHGDDDVDHAEHDGAPGQWTQLS